MSQIASNLLKSALITNVMEGQRRLLVAWRRQIGAYARPGILVASSWASACVGMAMGACRGSMSFSDALFSFVRIVAMCSVCLNVSSCCRRQIAAEARYSQAELYAINWNVTTLLAFRSETLLESVGSRSSVVISDPQYLAMLQKAILNMSSQPDSAGIEIDARVVCLLRTISGQSDTLTISRNFAVQFNRFVRSRDAAVTDLIVGQLSTDYQQQYRASEARRFGRD